MAIATGRPTNPVPPVPSIEAPGAGSRPRPLRIAMLAPPWIPIPPPQYGGIEAVVSELVGGLVDRGHAVTLFAAPGSRAPGADVVPLLDAPQPQAIGDSRIEADHVARAFALVDQAARAGRPFDVLHDHCCAVALAMADRIATPVLHTLHGTFDGQAGTFYAEHGAKGWASAISHWQLREAPAALRCLDTPIPNPIDVGAWPFQARKAEHLLWVGRMVEYKGAHRAIAVARRCGRPLVLAGPVQPGQEEYFAREIEPHVDGSSIRYVGEIGGVEKQRMFAEAAALLMPIRWREPFGMVMIEAMVTGTPVIAFSEGAASEVVADGTTGFLVEDEDGMTAAIARLPEIDPAACREQVARAYDTAVVARAYEDAYRRLARTAAAREGASELIASA